MAQQFDPESISFTADLAFVRTFLLTKPDGAAWRDFFEGSAGTTVAEFLAAMKSFLAYHTITGRAEAYLAHARKLTSARAAAEFLGHNATRGTRAHYRLTINPNFTGTISKFDILGAVRGLDVVAMETLAVNTGVEVEVEVVFADLLTESVNVSSGAQRLFRFTNPNVSDDFRVLLNSVEIPISQTVADLANDKSVTLTNAFGALDLFDLNDGTFTFDTGDTFQLQHAEFGADPTIAEIDIVLTVGSVSALGDFIVWQSGTAYTLNDIVVPTVFTGFYYRATVAGTSGGTEPTFPTTDGSTVVDFGVTWTAFAILNVVDVRLEPETVEQLKVNAPLTHETQKLIRGRDDYLKNYKTLDTRIVDTNGEDKNAAVVFLTAVKDDLTNFSTAEKAGFLAILSGAPRPFGVQPPIIQDPIRINLAIQVDITLLPNVTAPGDTTAQVTSAVESFSKLLEEPLDLGQMEALINQLENDDDVFFVQTTRLTITTDWAALTVFSSSSVINPIAPAFYFKTIDNIRTVWAAATEYDEGDLIVPTTTNGFAYVVDSITGDGVSGSSEPSFPTTIGNTVVDNEVTWKNIGPIIKPWQASFVTALDEIVSPITAAAHYFKAIDNIEEDWQASTVYALGDLVVPTNDVVNQNEFVFEATSVSGSGLSDVAEPVSWPITLGATQVDNDIIWTNRGTIIPRWQPVQTYTAGDTIVPATPTSPRRAFRVTSGGVSGSTEPVWDTVIGNPTSDGSVAWITVEEGETGAAEPTWPTATTDYVGDGAQTWETLLIGRTGTTEPVFPSTVGQTIGDDAAIWRNVGALADILQIEWNEYFFFAVSVTVT